jgi:hypothetical protein
MDHVYEIHRRDQYKLLHNIDQKPKSPISKKFKHLASPHKIQEGNLVSGDQRLNKSDCNDIRGVFSPRKKNIRIMREKKKLQNKVFHQLKMAKTGR